jgi:hypothetical protein
MHNFKSPGNQVRLENESVKFFSFIFFSRSYTYFIIQYSSQLSSRAGPKSCWVVTPAPGLHGGGGTAWESNPGLEINSQRVRIEAGTGLQQSSMLTTELRRTPHWAMPHSPLSYTALPTELHRTPHWATPHSPLSYAALPTELRRTPPLSYAALPTELRRTPRLSTVCRPAGHTVSKMSVDRSKSTVS